MSINLVFANDEKYFLNGLTLRIHFKLSRRINTLNFHHTKSNYEANPLPAQLLQGCQISQSYRLSREIDSVFPKTLIFKENMSHCQ